MSMRFVLLIVMLLLALAGCFRQAGEDFETIESQVDQSTSTRVATVTTQPNNSDQRTDDPNDDDALPPVTRATQINTRRPRQPTSTPRPDATENNNPESRSSQADTEIPIITVQNTNTPRPTATSTRFGGETTPDSEFITPEQPIEVDLPTPTATSPGDDVVVATDEEGRPRVVVTSLPTEVIGGLREDCLYTVQAGDSVYAIAIRTNSLVEDVMDINQMSDDSLDIGDVLIIPYCEGEPATYLDPARGQELFGSGAGSASEGNDTSTVTGSTQSTPEPQPTASPTFDPATGTIYRVQPGDTLLAIATRFGVTVNDIVEATGLDNPDRLDIGQELIIPATSSE